MAVSPADGSVKSKKYDRQLRLWGDHGQAALESAQVCLINATATGSELLKNVVLPGIASFTIVDGSKVSGEDIGNNFFLDRECLGKPRAQYITQFLLELNPDVRGDFVEESLEYLLENNPGFFNNFTVVIASSVCEKSLCDLAEKLWTANIPLIICRSYGFIGYIRLQLKEHAVIESHPDNAHEDLRLDEPFLSLQDYMSKIHLEKLDRKDHSHTPYLVVLFKYLQEWKLTHDGQAPKTYKEKNEFREILKKGILPKDESSVIETEENFDEAIKAVNTAFIPTCIPGAVQDILNHSFCLNLNSESKPFWVMARAVREFVANEGRNRLPLKGTIPDMTSDSEKFISLQNVYFNQALIEAEVVYKYVQQLLYQLGKPQDFVSEYDIKSFCKNCNYLRLIEGRSLAEEYNSKTAKVQEIMLHLDNPDSEMVFYVLLRAVERFFLQYGRYPGHYNDEVEPDIVKLKACLCKLLQEWGFPPLAKDDYVHEMCRYGASELHTVASYVGGCAAQEVIKIITSQYVPINNTYIYNAMSATSATFEL